MAVIMYGFAEVSTSFIQTYTTVCEQIKSTAWGHIWHIHRAAVTAGRILLSQGCIFGNSQLQHREGIFLLK